MKNRAIAVFDSGFGGLSVLREAVRLLPNERFFYYGDTLNAPYGSRTEAEIVVLSMRAVDEMMERGVKALVVACNTATCAAAAVMREKLPIPVIGMEPALKPASEMRKVGAILVMATPATLLSQKFCRLMEKYGQGALAVPCDGLAALVESGCVSGEPLRAALDGYLRPKFAEAAEKGQKVDAIVLGCTHYVFLREEIASFVRDAFGQEPELIDGNVGTVRQLTRKLDEQGWLRQDGAGGVAWYCTGERETVRRFFLKELPEAEEVW